MYKKHSPISFFLSQIVTLALLACTFTNLDSVLIIRPLATTKVNGHKHEFFYHAIMKGDHNITE